MLRHWAYIATLAPSRLRWRVAEMKPGTIRTKLSVAWISRLTSCCCFSGSTLKTLIKVMSFLSFVIFIMIYSSQLCRHSRLLPVAGRGDGSAKLWQHTAADGLKTCPLVAIMKAGNCDQFALIETDQRCVDHVFYRHDDLRGHLLPWGAGDVPAVGRGPAG